jgi:plastocyanin
MKTVLFCSLILSATALADTVSVSQKNKQFTLKSEGGKVVESISIKKGDTVRFVNDDDFFHNVFSLSDAKLFDLGSFPKGEHRDVVFDVAGEVEVECAIHPEMKVTIKVE